MFMSNEAFAEADRAAREASDTSERIWIELGMKVEEMKSFSPKELSNIPRLRKLTFPHEFIRFCCIFFLQCLKVLV